MDLSPNPMQVNYDDKRLRHLFPSWLPALYGFACIILMPWTIFLAYKLPPRYISHHWDIAWAGYDIFEIILFALTALLAVKKSSWTALSSTILGTVLLADGWFDVLTARAGHQQYEAIADAIIIELPLCILSYALAYRIFVDATHRPPSSAANHALEAPAK